MADTSLSQDSSEPEAELAVVKKKLRKKQMHSGLKEESPFPQPQPCVNGVLVQGLVSHIEEDNGCFWLQRDPDKVDGVGDMLMKGQEESYGSQDTPIKGTSSVLMWEQLLIISHYFSTNYEIPHSDFITKVVNGAFFEMKQSKTVDT